MSSVSAGQEHTCALSALGGVLCWGWGWTGGPNLLAPTVMPSLSSGVRAVLVDGFACALSLAGGVKCWGPNAAGQLGNGSTESSDVPTDVIGLSKGVVALAVGVEHACAVTEAGAVKCWGEGLNDMLGSDPGRSSAVPKDVLF